jgi:trichothecene 3-O-acetyltransferase
MDCQSTFVEPGAPLVPGCTKLPALDQVENRFILPGILVFHVESPMLRPSILQNLQIGLANTIQDMPFLAANVVPEGDELDTIQLEIPTEDAGVWFHVKEMPEIHYHELERREFPISGLPVLPLMPEPRVHRLKSSPVLTVQATFITDGLLLTLNAHHSAMDASGMGVFSSTWAKHVAAVSGGRLLTSNETLTEESLDRSMMFGGHGRRTLTDFPNYRVTKLRWRAAIERELMDAVITGTGVDPNLEILLKRLEISNWYISDESMRAIKKAASPPSAGLPFLTEHAIQSALLWRHITRARQLSARGFDTTSFVCTVNIRRRLDPPLPEDYPGNALVHAKTTASTADVESASPGTLYTLAKQITESIDWWTADRLWELIGAMESSSDIGRVEPAMDNFQGPDLEVTNTGSIGEVMRLEWGDELGEMKAMRYAYLPIKDGWVNVLPRRKESGIELLIALEKDAASRLREDKDWTSLAQECV